MVAEIFLELLLQVLFEKLVSAQLFNFVRSREGVHKKLKKWGTTLSMIQAVLSDAEEKQLSSKAVKLWLDDLRDLAYDVEDVLDKFFAEMLRQKIENSHLASTSKVWSSIPTCCASFSRSAFGSLVFKMDSEINEITDRLQDITQRKNELGLNDIGRSVIEWKRQPSSSFPDGSVIGRDGDKKTIIELLLRDQQSSHNFDVVGIVGLPGVGKTTLAGLVFHDDAVKHHFDIKVWVCLSDTFDCVRLTQTILKSINLESDINEEFDRLQEHLSRLLAGKKFLIVLDDVWNTSNDLHDIWVILRSPFRAGAPGSKIIVTTREVHVAKMMGAVQHHHLECVSDVDCWKIFVQHAFFTRNTTELPDLESLRQKILAKCNGLPLAARTLGGLLYCKEINEWEHILKDKLWTLSDQSNILPLLRLSYHHLPAHLKRCFAYCAILPEDYEFEEKQLILLWMAEGLIQQPKHGKRIEDLGREYFHELLSRSFFQKSRKDESKYVMHDLMNELAQWVAGEIAFRLEDKLDGHNQCNIFEKARHSSYISTEFDGIQRLEAFSKIKHLRTFLPLRQSYSPGERHYLTSKFTLDILPRLQYLRVLSLKGYYITKLPDSIGELKLLRYLDLSYTHLRSLPESISTLYNLQTLLLECCDDLGELPTGIKNLTNLRHLNYSNRGSLKGMPSGLRQLTNLQTLTRFVVGKGSCSSGLGELEPLRDLRGTLSILGLENVNGIDEATMANLAGKTGINVLQLKWNEGKVNDLDVLEMLQPPMMLKELTVEGYGGLKFPTWMGHPVFSHMVAMSIEYCNGCRLLPPLGQLVSLKQLSINEMSGINKVGSEFYGESCLKPFPLLEKLSFQNMKNWVDWSQLEPKVGLFPQLKELHLKRCYQLNGKLPESLPSLETLVVVECERLVVSIPRNQMLCKLDVKNCKEFVCENEADVKWVKSIDISGVSEFQLPAEGLTRLKHLQVCRCKEMPSLWQDELRQLTSLEHLEVDDSSLQHPVVNQVELCLPHKVRSLVLINCEHIIKLPEGLQLTLLQDLYIYGCPSLTCFPESGLPSSLGVLTVQRCKNLMSLVTDDKYSNCTPLNFVSSANGSLPSRLKHIFISDCESLQCLSSGKLPGTIRKLEIGCCDSLIWLSLEGGLPEALESLSIWGCGMLKSLKPSSGEAGFPKALKSLHIYSCGQLECIPDKFDHSCLESVYLGGCKNLRSLPKGLHQLINLRELNIQRCENLVLFPEGGLPASNLRKLCMNYDNRMVAYPKGMLLKNLIFLQELEISYSEGLGRVLQQYGFPPNLTRLKIDNLNVGKPLFHWGLLHGLTSLRVLQLSGEATDMVSFPPEAEDENEKEEQEQVGRMRMTLPKSLVTLEISGFWNLEKLSAGFQCLTFLLKLRICYCKKLKSLSSCGLPVSLLKLEIIDCPLLKKQCTRYEGRLWPLISHIPCVILASHSLTSQGSSCQ